MAAWPQIKFLQLRSSRVAATRKKPQTPNVWSLMYVTPLFLTEDFSATTDVSLSLFYWRPFYTTSKRTLKTNIIKCV